MPARQRPVPGLMSVAVAVAVAVGVAVALDSTEAFKQGDLWFADLGMRLRAHERDPENILIVAVDRRSKAVISRRLNLAVPKGGEDLPWPRWVHARVIRELKRAGAKVIAYNLAFAERRPGRGDGELVAAARETRRRLVVAVTSVEERAQPKRYRLHLLPRLRDMPGLGIGASKLDDDEDGTFRRVYPQIAVGRRETAAATASVEGFGATVSARFRGERMPKSDREWIAFAGPQGTFPRVPFVRVFDGTPVLGESFSGKVALVSSDAPRRKVPVGGRMSSSELEANVINTFLDGIPIREPSWVVRYLFLVAMASAPAGWILRSNAGVRRAMVIGVAGALASMATAISTGQGLSIDDMTLLPVTYGIAAFVLSAILTGLLLRRASGSSPGPSQGP